jgi:hypothetical protein
MSLEKPYQSSVLRRTQQVTHTLTLDLYRRSGEFWSEIADVRHVWQMAEPVPRQIPPRLEFPDEPWDGIGHFPPLPPNQHDTLPGVTECWDRLHDFCVRWYERIGLIDGNFLYVFLTGCVCYDPPHDDLIGFANHADNLLGTWHPGLPPKDTPPAGLPIAWIPDLDELTIESSANTEYYDFLFLAQIKTGVLATLASMGIDGQAIWSAVEETTTRGVTHRRIGRPLPSEMPVMDESDVLGVWARCEPMIEVHPWTSESDVREAFRWIRQRLPRADIPSKSPRDPLLCVQCAIWRDTHSWSEQEIGQQFGWTIQYPAEAKPRCETARQYIADGRALLRQ